ncbi:MAG: WXG100 family type VII secretion target [Bacilli bacterium]|nr:WXG100 family type VII secretion target [Bacilli bacterium]
MPKGDLKLRPAEVTGIGKATVDQSGMFKNEVSELYTIINNLNSDWHSEAQQAYVNKINTYKKDMEKLGQAIEGYGNFLIKTVDVYNNIEQGIKNVANKL